MSYPFEAFDLNPEQIKSPKRLAKRTGNRCGHEPTAPRLISVVHPYQAEDWSAERRDDLGHKRKNAWFYDVAEKLNQFYHFPRLIPALGLIYHEMTTRKHRSEAREADAALMTALTHHVELASVNWQGGFCRVGMPTKDGFLYFDNQYWCKKTGLTPSRLKRSFARLQKVGFIKRERRDWTEWKLVANLPYSVASPILVELAQAPQRPERMVVTLQLEVAQRLMAGADDDDYGVLTLLVQLDYAPREWFKIPARCFFPAPDVDSACVVLRRREKPLLADDQREAFVKIVKRSFSQRRKMMLKLLKQDWPAEKLVPVFAAMNSSPQERAGV